MVQQASEREKGTGSRRLSTARGAQATLARVQMLGHLGADEPVGFPHATLRVEDALHTERCLRCVVLRNTGGGKEK
jgi:hypothetical protein